MTDKKVFDVGERVPCQIRRYEYRYMFLARYLDINMVILSVTTTATHSNLMLYCLYCLCLFSEEEGFDVAAFEGFSDA